MDLNPYRSPQAAEPVPVARRPRPAKGRSWARLAMGVGCLAIALALLTVSLVTSGGSGPPEVQRMQAIVAWAAASSVAFALMGLGMLAHRDWLALAGLVLFALSFAAVVVVQGLSP
jgi:hypothetical protein